MGVRKAKFALLLEGDGLVTAGIGSPGQSAVSLKARFLQQPRHRLNTHLLPCV